MSDPETPLVFTFLYRHGGPIFLGLVALFGVTEFRSPLMIGVFASPLLFWLVMRTLNRRDASQRKESRDEDEDAPSESE